MAVNDVFRVSAVGRFGTGQDFVNVWYYRQVAGSLAAPMTDLISAWQDQVQDLYMACMPAANVLDSLEIRGVTNPSLGQDQAIGAQGGQSGDALPPQTASLVSWRTGFVGRRNRGRTYLPAPVETVQSAGTLSAGMLTAMADFAVAAIALQDPANLGTAWFHLVIYHHDLGTSTDVNSYLVRSELATQRRRRLGSGS